MNNNVIDVGVFFYSQLYIRGIKAQCGVGFTWGGFF